MGDWPCQVTKLNFKNEKNSKNEKLKKFRIGPKYQVELQHYISMRGFFEVGHFAVKKIIVSVRLS